MVSPPAGSSVPIYKTNAAVRNLHATACQARPGAGKGRKLVLDADVIATIGATRLPAVDAVQLVCGKAMWTGIEQCNGKQWTEACRRAVAAPTLQAGCVGWRYRGGAWLNFLTRPSRPS